jgi:beta-N-acetylhexosaminidase
MASALAIPLGAAMVDIAGLSLSGPERARLTHPAVGGVILFARNFSSPLQLKALTAQIAELRDPPLLIAVDQEGGRVQRFVSGFTRLPAPRSIGAAFDRSEDRGLEAAYAAGFVMARELRDHGITFSLAPVLDVDFGHSSVIGDRSFHAEPAVVALLGARMVEGMDDAGMAAVGKHFPGHGYARADSHHEAPVDVRSLEVIRGADLQPYIETIARGLAGVMPAHVTYPAADRHPAGFSQFWLQRMLREELGFRGMVFSDDLSMEGASAAGGVEDRAAAALEAGCDMVLICNAPDLADRYLAMAAPSELLRERVEMVLEPCYRPAPARVGERYFQARRALAVV